MNTAPNNGDKFVAHYVPALSLNLACLESPPLIPGEDVDAYQQLKALVTDAIRPLDIIEHILADDFVSLEWEILRYRRVKANLIDAARLAAVANALRLSMSVSEDLMWDPSGRGPEMMALKWSKGEQIAIEKVEAALDPAEIEEKAIVAAAVSIKLDDIERLDHMIMTMEARRNNALREAERHRINFGTQLRRATEQVEDADFRVIEEKALNEKCPS
jgi:hypothetical protein